MEEELPHGRLVHMKKIAALVAIVMLALPAVALADDGTERAVSLPASLDEYTSEHEHGTMSDRLATYDGVAFVVHDSAGGYFGADTIELQQDPALYAALAGPSEDHRDFDQGLDAASDSPPAAVACLVCR